MLKRTVLVWPSQMTCQFFFLLLVLRLRLPTTFPAHKMLCIYRKKAYSITFCSSAILCVCLFVYIQILKYFVADDGKALWFLSYKGSVSFCKTILIFFSFKYNMNGYYKLGRRLATRVHVAYVYFKLHARTCIYPHPS